MSDKKEKSALILEQEETFAMALASKVINKPLLSLWMILIPIFFVFYFNNLKKYRDGCKQFAENYIIDKKRALNEAVEVVNTGREPDIRALAELSNMNSKAREKQANTLAVLVEHYTILLNSDGEDFASLIRAAYGTLTNYLLFLNRLNQAEKEVNKALKPDLQESREVINDIVSRMEGLSERLRRETAESVFR
ncbi:MAG: hypothetical protein AMK71_12150 [Nitrospira bacterium SG8_35_4]|nr:MAG: hypothetical protein AMK71_12150 [Nitrospira bacterium SG8_35_4]